MNPIVFRAVLIFFVSANAFAQQVTDFTRPTHSPEKRS